MKAKVKSEWEPKGYNDISKKYSPILTDVFPTFDWSGWHVWQVWGGPGHRKYDGICWPGARLITIFADLNDEQRWMMVLIHEATHSLRVIKDLLPAYLEHITLKNFIGY